jgi:PAS domain S-box-containing protein
MAVRWGPDFVMIYNDGYRPILGDKHPRALGLPFHEVWPEVQPQLRPLHEALLAGKRAAFFAEDLLLRIQRHGAEWEDARFTISYSPIPDQTASSGVGGVLINCVETTNRVLMEEALRASEERFAGLFRQTSIGVVQCGLDGRFLDVNSRYCEIAARPESELLSLCVSEVIHPDDRQESDIRLSQLVRDGIPFILEKRYVRPDGSNVWVSSNVSLTRDLEGKPQNFIAVIQDVTERRRSQEQQQLLLGEMNHRVKNLFAITDGVISLSARSAKTPTEFANKIRGRLNALALAHNLILPDSTKLPDSKNKSTTLDNLLHKILSPYIDPGETGKSRRLAASGPPITVSAQAVTNLALVLHELATNAAKYGALSVPDGRVHVNWSEHDGLFALKWEERDGPALTGPPSVNGFGTLLSRHSIRGQFGGDLSYDWSQSGLVVNLSFPAERLRDE